jgi:methionyl-tRNA formyltransferase
MPDARSLRILFLGTPEFAATTLQKLIDEKANIVAVITAPDKPAGRGLMLQKSAVKEVAEKAGLKIFQPEKLKNPDFLAELKSLDIDLGIVVAFRMLPEAVWQMPKLGTFNLHASLLPKYRGAAPINWAIINGEKETGITTFFLKHQIDTGKILFQEKTTIGESENAGSLYARLMHQGAELVWKTVMAISSKAYEEKEQNEEEVIHAPKIFRETGQLDFSNSATKIHNLIRGLSPYPGAWCIWSGKNLKILESLPTNQECQSFPTGTFVQLHPGVLAVSTSDFWLEILSLQPEGKRKMSAKEFLAGHKIEKP